MASNHVIVTDEFKAFAFDLLRKAKLRPSKIEDLFAKKVPLPIRGNRSVCLSGLEVFRIAFIHKSVGGDLNYEILEFVGDVALNMAVVQYITSHFPTVISVKFLTRIKHNLVSSKELGKRAENLGFFRHIIYDKETMDAKLVERDETNDVYRSMLEDTLEAFVGALVTVLDFGKREKTGYHFVYNFISHLIDSGDPIEVRYQKVFDPKSRLKELFDKFKWPLNRLLHTRTETFPEAAPGHRTKHTVSVYGYPNGDRTDNQRNKVLLGQADDKSEIGAQHKACEQAIEKLKMYHIYENESSPYESNQDIKRARDLEKQQKRMSSLPQQ